MSPRSRMMPLNLVEKTVALLNSPEVSIWHYSQKPDGLKFYYYMTADPKDEHYFAGYEALVEAAYARIDPLQRPGPLPTPTPPEPAVPLQEHELIILGMALEQHLDAHTRTAGGAQYNRRLMAEVNQIRTKLGLTPPEPV